MNLSFSTINGESPTSPMVKYTSLKEILEKYLQFSDWADANTFINVTNPLPALNTKERWYTLNSTNILVNKPLDLEIVYYHQYFVTFVLN